jgi:hypothetical protein
MHELSSQFALLPADTQPSGAAAIMIRFDSQASTWGAEFRGTQYSIDSCTRMPSLRQSDVIEHSKMPLEIHPAMHDAHDFDPASSRTVKDDMRSSRMLPVPRPDVLAQPTDLRLRRDQLDRSLDLADIELGLPNIPCATV